MDALYRACFDDHLAGGGASRYGEVRAAYEADYFTHIAVETRLYPGVAAALGALVAFGPLACVTNKPERLSRRLLEALGVGDRFATVIGGDTCAEAKPSPLMLREAARRTAFDPAQGRAFMIGDTAADIRMGKSYGACTIWCGWGYANAAPDPAPDHVARTPEEVVGLVRATAA
jgi:phosphoglycolate phosphatase